MEANDPMLRHENETRISPPGVTAANDDANSAIAHVRQLETGEWLTHPLEDHLRAVATLSRDFAERFGAEWASLAGLWHDLGKYQPEFQRYIATASGFDPNAHIEGANRVNHSTAGAIHAAEKLGPAGHVLAYLIAGHHAGLPDWDRTETNGRAALSYRPEEARTEYEHALVTAPPEILNQSMPAGGPPDQDPAGNIRAQPSTTTCC